MTAGERMKADADFEEVLRGHEEEVAAWRSVVERYRRVTSELETSFGPFAFPRLMASFLATSGDIDCAQYGAQGLCRLATSTATKKWVAGRVAHSPPVQFCEHPGVSCQGVSCAGVVCLRRDLEVHSGSSVCVDGAGNCVCVFVVVLVIGLCCKRGSGTSEAAPVRRAPPFTIGCGWDTTHLPP
jgi:hypothetical protein